MSTEEISRCCVKVLILRTLKTSFLERPSNPPSYLNRSCEVAEILGKCLSRTSVGSLATPEKFKFLGNFSLFAFYMLFIGILDNYKFEVKLRSGVDLLVVSKSVLLENERNCQAPISCSAGEVMI